MGGCFRVSCRLGAVLRFFSAPAAPKAPPEAAPEGPPLGEKFSGWKIFIKGNIIWMPFYSTAENQVSFLKMSIFELTLRIFKIFCGFELLFF